MILETFKLSEVKKLVSKKEQISQKNENILENLSSNFFLNKYLGICI